MRVIADPLPTLSKEDILKDLTDTLDDRGGYVSTSSSGNGSSSSDSERSDVEISPVKQVHIESIERDLQRMEGAATIATSADEFDELERGALSMSVDIALADAVDAGEAIQPQPIVDASDAAPMDVDEADTAQPGEAQHPHPASPMPATGN